MIDGQLLDFQGGQDKHLERVKRERREADVNRLLTHLEGMYQGAGEVVGEYRTLIEQNPFQGVMQLSSFLKRVREKMSPEGRAWETIAGGPNPDTTGPILDAAGIFYETFNRQEREQVLRKILSFLDGLKNIYAEWQVEKINDPWLVMDIVINRFDYWPGMKDYIELLKDKNTWNLLQPEINKVSSRFFLAFTILHPEYSSLSVRQKFYKQFPDLIDSTEDAVAAWIQARAEVFSESKGQTVDEYVSSKMLSYDPLSHNNIKKKIKERKWIILAETATENKRQK